MGVMKEYDRRIRGGGDDAIAAVSELWESRENILFDITDAFTKARWIPVSERLPPAPESEWEDSVTVLAWSKSHGIDTACFIRDKDYGDRWGWECVGDPTHWMPLPEPPAE